MMLRVTVGVKAEPALVWANGRVELHHSGSHVLRLASVSAKLC